MCSEPGIDVARLVVATLVATSIALGLPGCVDLFHSTDDVLTGCQIDGQASGCALEASAPETDAPEGGAD